MATRYSFSAAAHRRRAAGRGGEGEEERGRVFDVGLRVREDVGVGGLYAGPWSRSRGGPRSGAGLVLGRRDVGGAPIPAEDARGRHGGRHSGPAGCPRLGLPRGRARRPWEVYLIGYGLARHVRCLGSQTEIGTVEASAVATLEAFFTGLSVLVIDDDADVRGSLTEFLQSFRARVVAARDGLEGLRRWRRVRPDLILCDLRMPPLDCFEFLTRLRDQPGGGDVLVVAVTSDLHHEMEDRVRRAGFAGFVRKPFDETALAHLVRRIFTRPGRRARSARIQEEQERVLQVVRGVRPPESGRIVGAA
jgi:CheY-like chemotaxis protein